mgnify:CR=1 FL=1
MSLIALPEADARIVGRRAQIVGDLVALAGAQVVDTNIQPILAGLFSDGAPAKFAQAVRSLLQDSVRRKQMGERGRFAARRHLSWDAVAARMEALYCGITPAVLPPTRPA